MSRYELTDDEFALLQPFLPPERSGKAGKPYLPHRLVLNGIFWILRSGAPWRDLPERYGAWKTVYDRLRRWSRSGLFQRILDALQAQARQAGKIDFDFSAVDGSTVRAHRCAAGAQKKGLRGGKAKKDRP
jgi:putative transposase